MIDVSRARDAVSAFQRLLDDTPSGVAHVRVAPDAWTLAEIVGHMIDSASNNHQRFARLRQGDLDPFPAYEAQAWVDAQRHDGCPFATLCALWTSFNAFLLRLVETTPEAALGNVWASPGGPETLEHLVNGYFEHMERHATHYSGRLAEVLAERA